MRYSLELVLGAVDVIHPFLIMHMLLKESTVSQSMLIIVLRTSVIFCGAYLC